MKSTNSNILSKIFQARLEIDYGSTEVLYVYGKPDAAYKLLGFGLDLLTLGFHVTILI
jgi:hypothetical protein